MNSIFSKGCNFVYTQRKTNQRPSLRLPEVAFIGRSNVGKSSLINTLVHSKKLVRSAKTPGSTISINYFNLADMLLLVDLPGFGYAKRSKAKVRDVGLLIENYLFNNEKLSLLIYIIDVRRGINKFSADLMRTLNQEHLDVLIVLSKIDKVSQNCCGMIAEEIKQRFSKDKGFKGVLSISSTKNLGLEELRNFIFKHCLQNE